MTDPAARSPDLTDLRRRKDAFFASGRGPLRGDALAAFSGLSYYPPDPGLVFDVPLERGGGEEVQLQTSSGEVRPMRAFGAARLSLDGVPATLTLYAQPGEENPESLFLPFRDAGSGTESYGAGRYLDVPVSGRDGQFRVTLDFNLAYHPYCAYGEGWTCPLPPPSNWLAAVVRAGERLP